MPPKLRPLDVPLPFGGMAPDFAGEAMPRDKSEYVENLLLDRPGRLVPRGPVNLLEDLATPLGSSGRLFGGRGWVFGDKVAFAAHDSSIAARGRQYWTVPYAGAGGGLVSGSSGPNSPGTLADDAALGDFTWSNPSNAASSNDSYATAVLDPGLGTTTHWLKATNLGFAVPAAATILGVVVEIERAKSGGDVRDEDVKLVKSGTIQGSDKASLSNWGDSDAYASYGGATDLWGLALTPTDINASNFGVALRIATVGSISTARVDHIRITVYYQHSVGGAAEADLAVHNGWNVDASNSLFVYDAAADTLTAIDAGTAAEQSHGLGLRGVMYNSAVYGPGYAAPSGSSAQAAAGGLNWLRQIVKWDGGVVAGSFTRLAGTVAPLAVMDVAVHYERLFALGGRQPNGSELLHWDALYYTNPGADPATLANWQTNGVNNKIQFGTDLNDPGAALAHLNGELLILKRRSVWILKGQTSDTFSVKQVTAEFGCLDPRSVVETDTAIYWMSQRGFVRWDGAQFSYLSDEINHSELLPAALSRVGDSVTSGGFVEASPLPGDYILLSVGAHRSINGTQADVRDLQYLFNTRTGSWVRFTGSLPTAATTPHSVVKTIAKNVGLGGQNIHNMSWVTRPEQRSSPASLMVDDQATDAIFTTKFRTRLLELASPYLRSQLHTWITKTRKVLTGTDTPLWSASRWTATPRRCSRPRSRSRARQASSIAISRT